jgi:hypothetical protein
MNARLRLLVLAAAVFGCAAALAQPRLRPGLWAETITVRSDNAQANAAMAQMKDKLASLPPEQRAAIEKMMAGRGMGLGGAGAPDTLRVCVTQAQIDRGFRPEDNGRCTRSNVNTSGSTTSFDFACKSERGSISGHGKFTTMGDSAFATSTVADQVGPKTTMHIESEIAGRFVSGDCGDVKPVETPSRR